MKTTRAKRTAAAAKTAAARAQKTASKRAFYSGEDPLGSYTGTPYNADDEPVQDADDL